MKQVEFLKEINKRKNNFTINRNINKQFNISLGIHIKLFFKFTLSDTRIKFCHVCSRFMCLLISKTNY